ncbi:putative 54S ribosomal protein L4, mitochondrial [Calycina marina]|uniref:Large ribosomal subunit protein uL29m n=1 Tax=Calycina marina TaxID=1763456 RepID=A0A9P7ZCH8_9HELO|nr:putative 54S ribosomal protein L4, mitochondrial [Calycina marina]
MSASNALRLAFRRLVNAGNSSQIPPSFLIPSLLASKTQTQTTSFSSTSTYSIQRRDNNPDRGVSTQRRTGPREPLSVSKTELPKPVPDPSKRSKAKVDPDHGLWEFFHSRDKTMNTPDEDAEYGRPWSVDELRSKSWEDLHSLWWMCCKERNRIQTERYERDRLSAGYGDFESLEREKTVRRTQRAIKHALTERYYSWRDALEVAKDDPEINLSGKGPLYTPFEYTEEDTTGEDTMVPEITDGAEVEQPRQNAPGS